MLIFFDPANPYVNQIHFFGLDWIQSIGVKFIFKLDNISMILTALTSFVFLLASFASKFNIRTNHKFYYSMLMLLMSAILGIFTAGDMFVFFLFWELELIPAYFLIGGKWIFRRSVWSAVLFSRPFWIRLSTAWDTFPLESILSSVISAAVSFPGLL